MKSAKQMSAHSTRAASTQDKDPKSKSNPTTTRRSRIPQASEKYKPPRSGHAASKTEAQVTGATSYTSPDPELEISAGRGADMLRVLEDWEVVIEEAWDSSDEESEYEKALPSPVAPNKNPQPDEKPLPSPSNLSTPPQPTSTPASSYGNLPASEIAHSVLQAMVSTFLSSEFDIILEDSTGRRTSYIGMSWDTLMEELRKGIDERHEAMEIPLLEELIGEGHVGPRDRLPEEMVKAAEAPLVEKEKDRAKEQKEKDREWKKRGGRLVGAGHEVGKQGVVGRESMRAGRKESERFEQGRKNQPAAQNGGKGEEHRYAAWWENT